MLRLSQDLPVVIEVVDTEEHVQRLAALRSRRMSRLQREN